MNLATLDLEGVLVPEIWIAFADAAGIPELRRTTRDEPDYDKLMRYRLGILADKGVKLAFVTLHVGLGTFRPVTEDEITDHVMHSEFYVMDEETAKIINDTRDAGGDIWAVGTTATRTLETIADETGHVRAQSGWTAIFIYPGYRFQLLDGLLTNFHLPESTLIMLVSAFAGYEHTMEAYRHAVEEEYRFYSFGDAMLVV